MQAMKALGDWAAYDDEKANDSAAGEPEEAVEETQVAKRQRCKKVELVAGKDAGTRTPKRRRRLLLLPLLVLLLRTLFMLLLLLPMLLLLLLLLRILLLLYHCCYYAYNYCHFMYTIIAATLYTIIVSTMYIIIVATIYTIAHLLSPTGPVRRCPPL